MNLDDVTITGAEGVQVIAKHADLTMGSGAVNFKPDGVDVHEYLIAYAPDEKPLWIVAVMHGRRNPRVLAAIVRGREK